MESVIICFHGLLSRYKGQSGELNLDGGVIIKKEMRVRKERVGGIRSCDQRFVEGYLRSAHSSMSVLNAFGGMGTNVQTSYILSWVSGGSERYLQNV